MTCDRGEVEEGSHEINSESVFKNDIKNFDGSVKKEDFVYTLLDKEMFTLDRSEVVNVASIMLNITKSKDRGHIDLDELQSSYVSYQKYQELIEVRIIDLFEKFKLCISKQLADIELFEQIA
jgi:hypothetical protein